MGAVVAMLAAAAEPSRVSGLVLTAPFLPVARDGRSRLTTAADYARHRSFSSPERPAGIASCPARGH